ncbi:D-xylose ABC transporter ATP-binding protein [candidate division KSB3 bacterium]|uniref:D-xylose ABC transporter ATP-binding protein n=1 Tax=candidate division KSB3 bacterium TaxID=2044937 RepID=A0A2G6E4Y2_9BACT|nr:MAG: D-xylose ABC transporter ATP-binding protein [candidate division KSB3 bacterium]PIE29401.1 MAG: D-xylose ABC transporter ATP-binding protein [candidate division KSB3 bacterium]
MQHINKEFPGVKALEDVNFSVRAGEVKALVGENGAGKSTLIKILTGAYTLEEGEIYVHGTKVEKMTPIISEELGIAAVYQNLVLAEHLTVAENVMMGSMPVHFGFISRKELARKTQEILEQIGYAGVIDPMTRVKELSASQQGMVAIVRALSRNAKIIIFDEPTAVLAAREVDELFRVIRWLREQQISIIYISHRMEEIFRLCDTVAVMKDGKSVGERVVSETTEDDLIAMMVGRDVEQDHYDPTREIRDEILRVEHLSNRYISDCSLKVMKGEIVGLYGLVGSGRTELSRALFGADPVSEGQIYVNGILLSSQTPRKCIDADMGLLPEDRRRQGLAQKLSVKHNMNMPIYPRIGTFGVINQKKEAAICDRFINALEIKTPSQHQIVRNLSGGNQQKVVVAKWLASECKLFLMDEPTNGIDVGAKEEIYSLINTLATEGGGILMISSYMTELMGICDRILVMRSGTIVANVQRKDFDEEMLLALAIKQTATNGGENRVSNE